MSQQAEAVASESLREADRQLAFLEDACLEEGESVPPWIVAARRAVQDARGEETDV